MTERDDPSVTTSRPKNPDAIPLSALVGSQLEEPFMVGEAQVIGTGAVREIGGRRSGLDPTRYGDWEKDGRCIDF